MTSKTLKEMVGGNLRIDLSPDGFTVTNGAGTAHYDKWGARTTVWGTPEYFPKTITVSGWENAGVEPASCQVSVAVNTETVDDRVEEIKKIVREIIDERFNKERRPGGKLFNSRF